MKSKLLFFSIILIIPVLIGVIISIKAGDHKIPSSTTHVQVSLDEIRLD